MLPVKLPAEQLANIAFTLDDLATITPTSPEEAAFLDKQKELLYSAARVLLTLEFLLIEAIEAKEKVS
jgi:hypothetical protein